MSVGYILKNTFPLIINEDCLFLFIIWIWCAQPPLWLEIFIRNERTKGLIEKRPFAGLAG